MLMRRKTPHPSQLNKHINFKREGEKSSARKDLTDVTCIICKKKFTLPFKPRKPEIYCDTCFKKKRKTKDS
jgi:CxxC-x17-CxxC domain-containing protein